MTARFSLDHTCPEPCKACDSLPAATPGQDAYRGRESRAYLGLGQMNRVVYPGPCGRCGHITLNGGNCDDCLNPKPSQEAPALASRSMRRRAA